MLIKSRKGWELPESEVTPEHLYFNRRQIMKSFGVAAAAAAVPSLFSVRAGAAPEPLKLSAKKEMAGGEELTPYDAVTSYNNFYEFGTDKGDPSEHAHNMTIDPWSIKVEGHAGNTGAFGVEDLVDFSALEERIYRLRCVEAWSMVIPWIGVPLSSVVEKLKPTSAAKFVQFETYANPEEMRGLRSRVLNWPYVEGLRMDEAMHPLTMMVVGLYGKTLPKQNGAPVRIVVPWKYGFKSIKSVVAIRFVETRPRTAWNDYNPGEYGFYSNVNPNVDHPRWSQKKERRIGEFFRRDTLMFNGYAEEVAHLYAGMDLQKYF